MYADESREQDSQLVNLSQAHYYADEFKLHNSLARESGYYIRLSMVIPIITGIDQTSTMGHGAAPLASLLDQ